MNDLLGTVRVCTSSLSHVASLYKVTCKLFQDYAALLQASGTPRAGAGAASPAELEAGTAPVAQPADATDKHMEEFFKEVTAIKVR